MAADEVFSKIAMHMIKGIMFHEQVANCYGFLSLPGYKECHEYHYYSEIMSYRHLYHYSLDHCHKLIKIDEIHDPSIISANWYKYTTEDVDVNTKRTAVRDLVKSWVEWERETKTLLETGCKELYEMGEIAAAMEVSCMLKDVCKELKCAEKKRIRLETTGYDIGSIVGEQHKLHEKYKMKIACLHKHEDK